MRTLDQSRPFAEIHGLPGASFEQDGIMFKSNGSEALSVEHIIDEIPQKDSSEPLPYVFCVEQSSESSESSKSSVIAPIEETQGRDLVNMHWRHLKALVEVYGEVWENKEKAIAFLKGKA